MKIVIAPDSFKDCLTAVDIAKSIAKGWATTFPDDQILCHPMADGGEGSMEAILTALEGERLSSEVLDPLGRPIQAQWAWFADQQMAVIEMAEASGLQRLTLDERNPMITSTYGTGQLILNALNKGAKKIILTIGGSATNDAGTGMLSALGLKLLNAQGTPIALGGGSLGQLACIDDSELHPLLSQTTFMVASDVNNPLCGKNGASAIFGPQKGANPQQVTILDAALGHFAILCQNKYFKNEQNFPGAGAAGGMGFAAKLFFNADFKSGVELIAELTQLEHQMEGAGLVITGEGKLDRQSIMGKTPMGVAKLAKKHNIPVIAIAGTLGEGYEAIYNEGIDAAFSLIDAPMSLEEAKKQAPALLEKRARDIAKLWSISQ